MEKTDPQSRQPSFLAFFIYISFHVFVRSVEGQCSGTAKQETFSYNAILVSTPGYDSGTYSTGLDCEWLFTTPITGETILYRFADVYIDCGGDTISSFNGNSSSAAPIQNNQCGTSGATLTLQMTSGTNLFIKFLTDGTTTSSNEKGAKIETVAGKDYSQCSSTTTIQLTSSGTETPLSSPNFPSTYPTNRVCTYVITASSSSATISIDFKFLEIDLFGGNCISSIKVYDGSTLIEPEFCSAVDFSPTKSFTGTAGNTLTVEFTAGSFAKRGFLAVYYETDETQTSTSTSSQDDTETSTLTSTSSQGETDTTTTSSSQDETETETSTSTSTSSQDETLTSTSTSTSSQDESQTSTLTSTSSQDETQTSSLTSTSSQDETDTSTLTSTSSEAGTNTADQQSSEPENPACSTDQCVPAVTTVCVAAGVFGIGAAFVAAYKHNLLPFLKKKVLPINIDKT